MPNAGRPHLESRHRRISRGDQFKRIAPWTAVFMIGFLAAWIVKPGPVAVDHSLGCTYVSVIPAKVLPLPKQVTVNVYNSTKRVGLASITSIDLKLRGFKAGIVDSSSEDLKGIGEIRFGAKARAAAQRLSAYVPGGLMKQITRADAKDVSVDLVLGPAFGNIAPNEQAAAMLAIPSASPSGKGCPLL